jgi:RHS repeat-associated protein
VKNTLKRDKNLVENTRFSHWVGMSPPRRTDYSPFGVLLQERTSSTAFYRRGFQGQEHDDEVKGDGNSVNFKYRMHDPRVGRFFAVDPLAAKYPHNSPYAFSENVVINMIELEGLETSVPKVMYMNDGFKTTIQAVDNTAIQKQTIKSLPQFDLNSPPNQNTNNNFPEPPIMQSKPLPQNVQLAKENLKNYGQYMLPAGTLLNKAAQGEEITWQDLGEEAIGIIPIGKVFSVVGKLVAKSEFAEGAVKELATFMNNNANESIDVVKSRLGKSIKSHANQIAKHKEYIANPKKKYGDAWDTFSDERKKNTIHHWKQDIKRHETYKAAKETAQKELK